MGSRVEPVALADDLVQLRVHARGWPSSCNVYVIRDGDGAVVVDTGLGVDPGFGQTVAAMVDALSRWSLALRDVHTIVLTHTHTDHAGGAIPLARLTGARVVLPRRGLPQASDAGWQVHHILPDEVKALRPELADVDVARHFRDETMPLLFGEAPDVRVEAVDEGAVVEAGRYRLTAHHLPGHDVAHLAWVDDGSGVGFTGDLLVARGTSLPWYPPNAGGVDGYLDSVARLATLPVELACPGHHDVVRGHDAFVALAGRTRAIVAERDRRLIEALLRAPSTFADLDDLVYDATVRQVIPWASSTTVAHLRALEQRGLVMRRDDGRYATSEAAAQRALAALPPPAGVDAR